MSYQPHPKSIILIHRNKWMLLYQRLQETENRINEYLNKLK